jgi:hypothetical protein
MAIRSRATTAQALIAKNRPATAKMADQSRAEFRDGNAFPAEQRKGKAVVAKQWNSTVQQGCAKAQRRPEKQRLKTKRKDFKT